MHMSQVYVWRVNSEYRMHNECLPTANQSCYLNLYCIRNCCSLSDNGIIIIALRSSFKRFRHRQIIIRAHCIPHNKTCAHAQQTTFTRTHTRYLSLSLRPVHLLIFRVVIVNNVPRGKSSTGEEREEEGIVYGSNQSARGEVGDDDVVSDAIRV